MRIVKIASREEQIWGIRLGGKYLSLAGPKFQPVYSERYRLGIWVLPLGGGWRLRLRFDQSPARKGE